MSLTPYDFKDNQQPDESFDGDDILESSKASKTGGNLLQVSCLNVVVLSQVSCTFKTSQSCFHSLAFKCFKILDRIVLEKIP